LKKWAGDSALHGSVIEIENGHSLLPRTGDPDPIIAVLPVGLAAQEENDFLLDVDRRAAKHLSRPRPDVGKLIEHEFKRDLFLFRGG
jgi:hypothetical protein